MGRIFLSHIGGTRLFSCASCDTPLTNRAELVSTRFTGTVKPGPTLKYFCFPLPDPVLLEWVGRELIFLTKNLKLDTH